MVTKITWLRLLLYNFANIIKVYLHLENCIFSESIPYIKEIYFMYIFEDSKFLFVICSICSEIFQIASLLNKKEREGETETNISRFHIYDIYATIELNRVRNFWFGNKFHPSFQKRLKYENWYEFTQRWVSWLLWFCLGLCLSGSVLVSLNRKRKPIKNDCLIYVMLIVKKAYINSIYVSKVFYCQLL